MASKQPSHTTQTTEVKLPKWVDEASQKNYQLAEEIAAKPLEQYGGPTVAGPSQTTLDAYGFFKDSVGTGMGQINEASGLMSRVGQGIAGLDRSTYMNPYIDEVENKALSALNDTRVQALMGNADKAAASKAFGGSRHGIVDAVTNAETAKSAGLLSADLRKSGFDTASNLMQQDVSNMATGATGLLGAGQAAQQQRMQDFTGMVGIGQAEQQQSQREIDADVGKFNEARDYDLERLNVLLSSLGMSPYGKSESTDKVTSGGSSGTDFAAMGLGVLQLLPALFGLSDETIKTDKKKVGKDPITGIDVYSYRYKGDPKTYPKVVGPMAQDIEKAMPGSTIEVAGKRAVPMGLLNEITERAV